MRGKYFFRYMLLIILFVAATMGCKLIENVRSTVQLASTGVAVATDIGGMITQIVPPGMEQTVQAGMPTIQSAITQVMPTFQAAMTEGVPTLEALTTQMGKAPDDIPVMPGETSAFVGTAQSVNYLVKADFQKVVDFYKTEMPNKGWKSVDAGTAPSAAAPGISNAELHFEKGTRKATVIIAEIPFVGQTTVAITIEGQ